MAMEYSEDTSTRKEGGDLGYFKKGELLPALEREASKLQIGEVSGLIRTELVSISSSSLIGKEGKPLLLKRSRRRLRQIITNRRSKRPSSNFLAS